jgi:hypothetical protein
MDKDLEKEYLEDLDHYDEGMGIHSTSYGKCKERLIRLAKIDNAKPSQAMNCLERFNNFFTDRARKEPDNPFNDKWLESIDTIKQTLIKSQEMEKVLEIINKENIEMKNILKIVYEKNVDIIRIKHLIFKSQKNPKYWDLRYYNETRVIDDEKLTQEEFEILKEIL